MTDPIRLGGFFSTFDYEAVITQLTNARMVKVQRMDVDKARADVRKTLVAEISSKLSALLSRTNALMNATSMLAKSATVTGTGVSAAAGPGASVGSFTVGVTQLATGTRVGGTAITAALDAASPMNKANFGVLPTNGTFTIGTAGGGTALIKVGATAADTGVAIDSANFATAVTAGTFTLATETGGSVVLNVDPATQSVDDMITAINGAGVGVTATVTNDANGRANILSLSSTQGAITLGASGDTSNFWAATNLSASSGTTERAGVGSFTAMQSLNQVINEINTAGVGITATITNDANGRPNLVSLSAATAINLGNATDTSNFLSATNLIASSGTTARVSTMSIARLNPAVKMDQATWFGGAPAAGDHSFTVNGKTINYNAANDTLNDVIGRINGSGAGVTARYDTATDSIKIEQAKTGTLAITFADDGAGGNFLAKTGILAATQTMGQNAAFSIDGGPTQYSDSNTVTPLNGVTVTLQTVTDAGSPPTVTVGQNSAASITAIKGFVTEFNAVLAAVQVATKTDPKDRNNSGELSGDASVRQLVSSLRTMIVSPALGLSSKYTTLGEVGLSFGAVGSAVGTTNTLQFDEGKFTAALAADPAAVQALMSTITQTATLQPGGTSSVTGLTGAYTGTKTGTYKLIDGGLGTLTAEFTPNDGGPVITASAPITAGGTNTTLIPGMTISIGAIQAGESIVTVGPSARGPLHGLKEFVEGQAGVGGVLSKRQSSYDAIIKDITERQDLAQERIEREMDRLRKKFLAMEQAQARYQAISQSLQSASAKLAAQRG